MLGPKSRLFSKVPERFGPKRKLTSRAEFLLTLMRLRLGLTGKDLTFSGIRVSMWAHLFVMAKSMCKSIRIHSFHTR